MFCVLCLVVIVAGFEVFDSFHFTKLFLIIPVVVDAVCTSIISQLCIDGREKEHLSARYHFHLDANIHRYTRLANKTVDK